MQLTSEWFWPRLVCPVHRNAMQSQGSLLRCAVGHDFPVVEGIPVLLVSDGEPTYPPFEEPSREPAQSAVDVNAVDPFVQQHIVRTNGKLYRSLRYRLKRYPVPELPLPDGDGHYLLEVGSNWGRWTIAAARKGYRAVGVDSSLTAVQAGRRVARQLGVEAGFVVADARYLPFQDCSFDVCFSFSVLQHLDKKLAGYAVKEMARVTHMGGRLLVQMPNRFGLVQMVNRARQVLTRNHSVFRVRYWTAAELRSVFEVTSGPAQLSAASFFSLNAEFADLDMLPWREAALVRFSEVMRRASRRFPGLTAVADSLYVESRNVKAFARRDFS